MVATLGGWTAVAGVPVWQGARTALAGALVLAVLLLLMAALRRMGPRRPLGLLGPLAVGLLVAGETLFLNLLSLADLVTAPALVAGHLLAAAGLAIALRTPLQALRRLGVHGGRVLRRERALWWVLPLAALTLAAAWIYPPTTYDAMTYHMARVAHWIQNQSIAFYPSSVDRQNWMGPGAEYLILVVQAMADSDLWANSVQWLAWILCLAALPGLCRLGGVPRRLAPWTAVCMAGLPMGVLQSCSTQTDLVAALMALAIAAACLPLLHRVSRWRRIDVGLLALMLASGFLVKPTALLAAAPFLLYVAARAWRQPALLRAHAGRLLGAGLPAVLALACVVGPHMARTSTFLRTAQAAASPAHPQHWSYGLLGEWKERALNPLLATYAHHSLGKDAAAAWLHRSPSPSARRQGDLVGRRQEWVPHEDFAGNPFHLLLGVITGLWLLLRAPALKPRALGFALVPFLAWIAFHLFIRNQIWLSRLQTPLFFLLPLSWAATAASGRAARVLRDAILIGTSLLCLGFGYADALRMRGKPLWPLPATSRDERYYVYAAGGLDLKRDHDKVLDHMAATGAVRLGLVLGADSFDYPLTWRAMHRGIQVRHCGPRSPWPDAFFTAP